MSDVFTSEIAASQVLTVACSAVGAHWSRDFPICVERGLWGSKSSTAKRMRHAHAFERMQPGQLGIAVHGFRWQDLERPPRNAAGAICGPRVPFEHFVRAQFSEFALFEVEAIPYTSIAKMWSETEPDEWDLRVPINVFAHERGIELRMNEINPDVAEAIRKSGIYASMPWVIAPATLGISRPETPPNVSARTGPTDALGLAVRRTEASRARQDLLAGRPQAPCSFCAKSCLEEDLEAIHLKARSVCNERERLDPGVVVLACVACHRGYDAGAFLVDADGVIRITKAAGGSEWRQTWLASLDGYAFASFGASNETYLAWHREQVARPLGS